MVETAGGAGEVDNTDVVMNLEANAKKRVGRAPMLSKQSSLWSWGLAHNPGNDSHVLGLPGASRYAVQVAAPVSLPTERARVEKVLSSNFFALSWATLIIGNMVLIGYDVDAHARDEASPSWTQALMVFFVLLYMLEIILRLYVSRLLFFERLWNNFDFAWVMAEALLKIIVRVDDDVPLMSVLRVLGALGRVVRIFRISLVFRDLFMLVQGMLAALRKILWSSSLIVLLLIFCSIFAVEYIHPLNIQIAAEGNHDDCHRCKHAFESVMQAKLTFISNALGGGHWETVCVPIMEKHPWTVLVFLSVLFSLQLGLLSLILSVLVDGVQRLQTDVEESSILKAKQLEQERANILRLFRDINVDSAGAISLEKFTNAFDSSKELAAFFALMDIHREDLPMVFSLLEVMQVNGSGEMSCADLVDQLISLKMLSPQRLLLYNSYSIQNQIADGMRSMWESSSTAHGTHSKQLKHLLDLAERRGPSLEQVHGVATIVDASSAGIAHEWKAFRPKLPEEGQGQTVTSSVRVGEEEVQRCMDRLRQCVEDELSSIASTVAASLREAAARRPPPPPPTATASTALPGISEAAAFTVVDEVPPMASSRLSVGVQDSARKQNLAVIAGQVQADLLKFQTCINETASLAADKLGGTFPDDPVARDYQVALVQLQLRLNEGLSMAMSDVMTKIHPGAQHHEMALLGAVTAELLHLPSSRKIPTGTAPLGGHCGLDCGSRRFVIVANDSNEPHDGPCM